VRHETTNFHNLQLTLHLVVVAVLFEPQFEVINLGGLKYFRVRRRIRTFGGIHSPGHELHGHAPQFSSSAHDRGCAPMLSVIQEL
jgi:hypothetical protein